MFFSFTLDQFNPSLVNKQRIYYRPQTFKQQGMASDVCVFVKIFLSFFLLKNVYLKIF